MHSKQFLTAAVVGCLVLASMSAGVTAAGLDSISSTGDGVFAENAIEDATILGFDDADTVTYGSGTPGWHVYYSENKSKSLQDWADGTESEIKYQSNASNHAVIAASPGDIGVSTLDRWLGNGLQSRTYIEAIEPVRSVENVDPIRSLNESETWDDPGRLTQWTTSGDLSPAGVAFSEDTEKQSLADARSVVGADNVSETGEGVTVAVIDSGVNTADGEVFGNGTAGSDSRVLPASKSFLTNTTVEQGGHEAVASPNLHGSWVAAAAAGSEGVAPDADILALQALAEDGSGNTADIAEAVRYAADQDADVIAMSLGSPMYSESLARAIQYARENGVTSISVATGNSRSYGNPWMASPSDVDGTIAVQATNTTAPANASAAYFGQHGPDAATDASNGVTRGESPDVSATGMNLTAEIPREDGQLVNETLSGTSMAQPFVAGGVAVALEAHPSWKNETGMVTERVRNSSTPMPNAAAAEVGSGMFSVDNLVSEWSPNSQQSSMTETADARDEFWRSLAGQPSWLPFTVTTKVVA